MIVVDVGCHPHGNEESVYRLIDRFHPDVLFGFDPWPELDVGVTRWKDTVIVRSQIAAWLTDGFVAFDMRPDSPIGAGIVRPYESSAVVACFDLREWLRPFMLAQAKLVLKFDCEGAEFPLLHAIRDAGYDVLLEAVLVEWHENDDPNGDYYHHGWKTDRPELRCPVEKW